ncbi:hypothetical protein TEA_006386 [Camellia sinensis var. sinensis]|uniref:Uncharacterized protein n=1 Tax=Camellia sinensis var. sinensis TaxID=542762 RepID=A0A4V6RYE5_CAMSN|nr:hypothetical protein TEA_006386 [Camellia sinensis var. sinensis]
MENKKVLDEKNMAEITTREEENKELINNEMEKDQKLGGMKTMPFIVINEMCDRMAAVGIGMNLITYLIEKLNLPIVSASNTLTNFGAAASFIPLIGALIADSFAGRFWTILFGSIIYQLPPHMEVGVLGSSPAGSLQQDSYLWIGEHHHISNTATTSPSSMPYSRELPGSLILTAMGSLSLPLLLNDRCRRHGPNVITFAADQFDMTKSKVESRSWNFNWVGARFWNPSHCHGFLYISLYFGHSSLQESKTRGSPLVRLVQVIVAAWKKRKEVEPEDLGMLYQSKELDALISSNGRLLHTDQFK